jgi:hypothetical protein
MVRFIPGWKVTHIEQEISFSAGPKVLTKERGAPDRGQARRRASREAAPAARVRRSPAF